MKAFDDKLPCLFIAHLNLLMFVEDKRGPNLAFSFNLHAIGNFLVNRLCHFKVQHFKEPDEKKKILCLNAQEFGQMLQLGVC